ncbi:STAS domain-containing protein [Desulfuribacillus alkaliarsenatis]|uniref:Anti-anti-sigma factor n=1 Tax=Desulfuribacillus alkaliarsenatis TaxID=766136 RepID=A0A1E5G5L8_9FIRM|nr:STAS domain-containing protein [Desulfuribacillus alkaliarsenatis]OEF98399.1 anti-anti-sigma factor [Desulfuribacillus alkaliarsenatis]
MEIRKSGSEACLEPTGRIDMSNSHILKEKLLELYNEGFTVITVDFSQVNGIDSSGLGKLLLFQKKLKEKDGELIVKHVKSEYIRKMFEMIHLDKVIRIINE